MKVVGYVLSKQYDRHYNEVPVEKMLTVIECGGLEVRKHEGEWISKQVDPAKNYRVYMRGKHPTKNFFVIGCKMVENKVYEWMTLEEAERIVERAISSDIVDLREFGDYHICEDEKLQTVIITNDYDDYSDEPIPIAVSLALDDED